MEIRCELVNVNSDNYSILTIHKLKKVIFINRKRDRVDIYTEIILGGSNINDYTESSKLRYEDTISNIDAKFSFKVNHEIRGSEIELKDIKVTDLTDSYYNQTDKSRMASSCEYEILDRQPKLKKMLKSILPEGESIDVNKTNTNENKYLGIKQGNSDRGSAVCVKGHVKETREKQCMGYEVCAFDGLHKGVEIINWIKTSIYLSKPLESTERLSLEIVFPTAQMKLWIPYCSVYICPPENYELSDDSKVSCIADNVDEESDQSNNINSVVQKREMYYEEWIDAQMIMDLKVYRLNREKLFGTGTVLENCKKISMDMSIRCLTDKGSIQFLLGLIFSGFLTFGVDSGRIKEIEAWFITIVPVDIQWVVSCLLLFTVTIKYWLIKRNSCSKRFFVCNAVCMWAIFILWGVWFIAAFVLSRITELTTVMLDKIAPIGRYAFGISNLVALIVFLLSVTVYKNKYAKITMRGNLPL